MLSLAAIFLRSGFQLGNYKQNIEFTHVVGVNSPSPFMALYRVWASGVGSKFKAPVTDLPSASLWKKKKNMVLFTAAFHQLKKKYFGK